MNVLFYIPFLIQTLVIGLDEFHFHLKRGLPKWERIGHPIDTLSVVLALAFTLVFPYQIYIDCVYYPRSSLCHIGYKR